jgi:hypothetical protein
MKALLVLSIIGIILCSFFLYESLGSSIRMDAIILFIIHYIFVIPHAIVSHSQSKKQKNSGLKIMAIIGFVLYFSGLYTAINGLTFWNIRLAVNYEAIFMLYILSYLFFLLLAIVCIVLSVKFFNEFLSTHRVKLLTNTDGMSLRKTPNPDIEPFEKIPNGTEIQYLSTGSEVQLGEINGYWFKIRTKEKVYGWCFSGSLEKI